MTSGTIRALTVPVKEEQHGFLRASGLVQSPLVGDAARFVWNNVRDERVEAHMTDDTRAALRKRITMDPAVLVGKSVIRGMRISVAQIVESVAAGVPQSEPLEDYPGLEPEDIQAA
jgi:uncharacterized protein (DUF433 family)